MRVSKSFTIQAATFSLITQVFSTTTPAYAFWFLHRSKPQTQALKQTVLDQSLYPRVYSNKPAQSTLVPLHNDTVQRARLLPANQPYANQAPVKQISTNRATSARQDTTVLEAAPTPNTISELPPISPIKIKVAIGLNIQSAKITVIDGAQLIDNNTGKIIANLPGQSYWIVSSQNDQIVFQPRRDYYFSLQQLARANTTSQAIRTVAYLPSTPSQSKSSFGLPPNLNAFTLPIQNNSFSYTLKPALVADHQILQEGILALNDRPYRGAFIIQKNNRNGANLGSFNVINHLDLEDYLLSVVPSEMPSSWPDEALKAQAIAARSYAMSNLGKYGSAGFDLKDNTEDQMYLGVKSETEATNCSVNATNGLVLKYEGKPVCAYFHSASGGATETAEHVWHRPVPYLKAVLDFDQNCPLYSWTKNYSIQQTEAGLPNGLGPVLSISVLGRSPSGRATVLLINTSNGSRLISGEAARKYFSLPSTNFNVTPSDQAYIFTGKGFGHGLGLSQWGARALAAHGYNAAQILCYYYNGVSISR